MTKLFSLSTMVATCLICTAVQAQESIEQLCFDSTAQPAWALGCTGLAAGVVYACPFEGLFELSICADAGTAPSEGEFDSWVCAFSDNLVSGTVQQLDQEAEAALQTSNWSIHGINPGPFDRSNCTELSPTASPSPSLSINQNSMIITQGVNNFTLSGQSNITLVQGKNAAIQAVITIASPKPNDPTPMIVIATMPDGTTATSSPIPMASIDPSNGVQITLAPVAINSSGVGTINLQASAADAISSNKVNESVIVKKTNSLNLIYYPLGTASDFVPTSELNSHIQESNLLVQAMYPLSENGINTDTGPQITAASLPNGITDGVNNSIMSDLGELAYEGTISDPAAQAAIAVVSTDYFPNHGVSAARGIAQTPTSTTTAHATRGAIVADGYWNTTAHELAHTFGIGHAFDAPNVTGFWVDAPTGVPNLITNAVDLMNYSANNFENFTSRWISSGEYGQLFQALLTNPSDPQVIVVAGLINQDGSVTMKPTAFLQNGFATAFDSSTDGNVSVTGSNGATLVQSSFSSSFSLTAEDGAVLPTTSSFFLVQVPVLENAETIEIFRNGNVIKSFNPNSQLLVDAIQEIPSTSFVRNAQQEEQSLVAQAKWIESLLNICQKIQSDKFHDNWLKIACTDEVEELVLMLRAEINDDLNNSAVTPGSQQMNKSEVLSTVDFTALQLLGSPTIQASGHPFVIRILPNNSKGVLNVSSATQGTYGSVYINTDGTLTYKPVPGEPQADSFTVTVQDAEGLTTVKTITIITPCFDNGSIGRWATRFL